MQLRAYTYVLLMHSKKVYIPITYLMNRNPLFLVERASVAETRLHKIKRRKSLKLTWGEKLEEQQKLFAETAMLHFQVNDHYVTLDRINLWERNFTANPSGKDLQQVANKWLTSSSQ